MGVLDADITGPSIPMMFGLHKQPVTSPLGILPVETRTGIKVMSINLLLASSDQAVIWRGPLISNVIKQFWNDVVWGKLDYLVVDLPPGTSDASLTVMQSIPLSGVVLVTSPQDLAGMVVRKAAQMAERLGAPICRAGREHELCHLPGVRSQDRGLWPQPGDADGQPDGGAALGEAAAGCRTGLPLRRRRGGGVRDAAV